MRIIRVGTVSPSLEIDL